MLRHLYGQLHTLEAERIYPRLQEPKDCLCGAVLRLERLRFLKLVHGIWGQVSAPHFHVITDRKATCTPAASNAALNMIAYEGTREPRALEHCKPGLGFWFHCFLCVLGQNTLPFIASGILIHKTG